MRRWRCSPDPQPVCAAGGGGDHFEGNPRRNETPLEGPFGEFTGYYAAAKWRIP
jgi:hypothetical protein